MTNFLGTRAFPDPPKRPKRRLPTHWEVAEYWAGRDVFMVSRDEPECFGCGTVQGWAEDHDTQTPKQRWNAAKRWLQKAHIVARVYGGLDGPQNIALLCDLCHSYQPDDNGADAIAWIAAGGIGWGEARKAAIMRRERSTRSGNRHRQPAGV